MQKELLMSFFSNFFTHFWVFLVLAVFITLTNECRRNLRKPGTGAPRPRHKS